MSKARNKAKRKKDRRIFPLVIVLAIVMIGTIVSISLSLNPSPNPSNSRLNRHVLTLSISNNQSFSIYQIEEVDVDGNITVVGSNFIYLSIEKVGYPYSLVNINGSTMNISTSTLAIPLQRLGQNLSNVDIIDFFIPHIYTVNLTFDTYVNGVYYYVYRGNNTIIVATYYSNGMLQSYAIYEEIDNILYIDLLQVTSTSYISSETNITY